MTLATTASEATSRAEIYERELVHLFSAWADRLADLAAPRPGAYVLDVACGTGMATREVARRLGTDGRVEGLDADAAKLDVARDVADVRQRMLEWRLGDVHALPFADGTFDLVTNNEGLQFFADASRALEEMRRVLRPDGRLALAVWRPIQHLHGLRRLVEVLEKHLTPHAAALRGMAGPWERSALRALVASAGFHEVHVRIDADSVRWPSVERCLHATLGGSPLLGVLGDLSPEQHQALVCAVEESAGDDFLDDDGLLVPFEAYLLTAVR